MSMNHFRIEGNTLVKYTGNDATVVVPDGVHIIGGQAFGYNINLVSVVLPEGTVTIGERAFDSCQNLQSVTIPSSVALIEKGAFGACRSLDNVVIPDGVPYIATKTFYGCRSLKSITIPDSVTSIGDEAFKRCTSLCELAIGDNVTEIGQEAFADCLNLKTVSIGKGVGVVCWNTFANCLSLEAVGLSEGLREVEYGAFDNCPAIRDLYFYGGEDAWRAVTVKPTRNASLTNVTYHFDCKKAITTAGKAKPKKDEPEVESVLQISFDILDDLPVTTKAEEIPAVVEEATPVVTDDVTQIALDFGAAPVEQVKAAEEQAVVEEPVVEPAAVEAPVVEAPVVETPVAEKPVVKKPLERKSNVRTTPKAAVSDVTEEFKKNFYESYVAMIPLDVAATQQARAESMTDDEFETLSEALFLVPAQEAYEFGCLCLYLGKYNWAFRSFLAAAGKGNLPSQFYVGGCFLYGIDTTKKIVDAARWLTKCKNDATFGNDARRLLAIVDAELEKPENAGLKVKRGNK